MTKEYNKLIEAANMIKEHCLNREGGSPCCFAAGGKCNGIITNCGIGEGELFPSDWDIPNTSRWSNADVALAKALMAFGSTRIYKNEIDNVAIYEKNGIFPCDSYVPEGAFISLNHGETVMLKDIVAEGENDG